MVENVMPTARFATMNKNVSATSNGTTRSRPPRWICRKSRQTWHNGQGMIGGTGQEAGPGGLSYLAPASFSTYACRAGRRLFEGGGFATPGVEELHSCTGTVCSSCNRGKGSGAG